MKKILSLLLVLLAASQTWALDLYSNGHAAGDEGTLIGTFTGTGFPYTYTWNYATAGTYYFYMKDASRSYTGKDANAEATVGGEAYEMQTFQTDGTYYYRTYERSIKVVIAEAGSYMITVASPASRTYTFAIATNNLVTFAKGSTWYFDFTAVSGAANWPNATDTNREYNANAGGTVQSTTFTKDITKNLGEAWDKLKTNTGGWKEIALPETAPADGVNCIVVAADGLTASWSTYTPDPADVKTPFTFANGSTWYFDFTAVSGGANWPNASGGSSYHESAGGTVRSTTFTQDITKNLGEAWGVLKTATGSWTGIELPETAPADGVNCIVIAADGLTASWGTYNAPQTTLYFVNKDNWTTVQAHMWDGTASGTTWPGLAMTNTGEQAGEKDIYSISFDEGAYAKIIFNNKVNDVGVQTGNQDINPATPYYYDGSWYADVTAIEAAMADVLKTNIYLAGSFNGWSPSSHNFVRQNLGDEVAYTTIAGINTTGYIEFKVVEGGQWCNAETQNITSESTSVTFRSDNSEGYQVKMTPYAAGDYVVAFNLTTRVLTVTYPEGEPMPITYHVELAGSFNDWGDHDVFTETATEGVFSLTKSFEKGEYQLKVVENSSWRGADYIIKRDYCSNVELNSTETGVNVTLQVDKAGDYTFIYNVADHTLSVTYPTLGNHTAYFINTTGYAEVYAYVYNNPSWTHPIDWPGELATKTGDKKYGYDVYSYTFPETYNAVIFHGNAGSQVEFAFDPATPYITEAGAVAALNDVVAVEATISPYQYSTLYSDKALRIPAGVAVEYVSAVEDNTLVTETLTDIIPANTGVLISGPANANFAFVEAKTVDPIAGNLLRGTTTTETIANNGLVHYILSLDENDVFGLYWPSGTDEGVGPFTNQGGKAYLEIPAVASVAPRGFVLRPNQVPTAVEPVETTIDAAKIIKNGQVLILRDGGAYNLLGVRIF